MVGILPGFRGEDANHWVAVPVVTGMDQARNVVLVRSCHAVIAMGGMYGTLSEIAIRAARSARGSRRWLS